MLVLETFPVGYSLLQTFFGVQKESETAFSLPPSMHELGYGTRSSHDRHAGPGRELINVEKIPLLALALKHRHLYISGYYKGALPSTGLYISAHWCMGERQQAPLYERSSLTLALVQICIKVHIVQGAR